MPTIFEIGPFRIIIRTRDHLPAHVHCRCPDGEVLIEIESLKVIRNHGVHLSDVRRLKVFVSEKREVLMNEWEHFHGKD